MKPGEVIDWATVTDRQLAEGDPGLRWRIARWAALAVQQGAAVIAVQFDPFTHTTSYKAIYHPMNADQRARMEAKARRWEREAIEDERARFGFPPYAWLRA